MPATSTRTDPGLAPPRPRGRSRRPIGAIAVAVAAALGVVATYVGAVRTTSGQQLDTRVMDHVVDLLDRPAWAVRLLDVVGPVSVLVAMAALIGVALCVRGVGAAWVVVITVTVTVVVAAVLKEFLDRPVLTELASNSLPSGHVAAVAALAVSAYLLASRLLRRVVLLLGLVGVLATAIATVALGWHRPSDVVASALLAIAVGAATYAAVSD